MSIQFIPVKCPNCNSSFDIEKGQKEAYCAYCGTKILVDNGRDYEYTYRRVDEAAIKRAETEQLIRLKELELEDKKREDKKEQRKRKTIISIIIGIISAILLPFGMANELIGIIGLVGFTIIGYIWISG